ncbi:oligosaccharide flippase family protein [Agreia sp. PsM10]|uniref:lipopolysaccharide biosynthesis protein n=1 Tax=Agreia sp. PsM10 TaxID=3030533 RepID=UPI00263B04FE|nr:oligosaccharide flippase family protein [Agreia sp. PsM10]MDN4641335.1 oligosaccharide flippase family protein [Agreia sp. PsM10]
MNRLVRALRTLKKSRTARRFALVTAGRAFSSLVQAVSFALIARFMGVVDFGAFSIGYSAALLLMTAFEFGLGNRSLRLASDKEPGRTVATILSTRFVTNLVVFTAVLIGWQIFHRGSWNWGLALALYVTGDLFGNLTQSILIGSMQEYRATIILIVRRIIPLGALLIFLWVGDSGTDAAYTALALTGAVGYTLGIIPTMRLFGRPRNPITFIRQNHKFATTSLASNLQQADSLVIGAVGGTAIAGLYGAASRLAAPLNLVTGSLTQSIVPSLSAMTDPDYRRSSMARVMRLMTIFAILLATSAVFSPLLVWLLYGDSFMAAWPLAAGVILIAAFNSLNQPILGWYYAHSIPTLVPVLIASSSVATVCVLGLSSLTRQPWVMAIAMVSVALVAHVILRTRFSRDLRTPDH